MKETEESCRDSCRSKVSSPGMPKTYLTPSASRHSTNRSDALRALNFRNSSPAGVSGYLRTGPQSMSRCLSVILATLAFAAPAGAKTTFTIKGAGFGHGVGMSQYGAMGYASHGWSAAQIMGHYYSGTALGTTDPNQKVRVRLIEQTSSVRFSGAKQAGSRKLDPAVTYTVKRRGLTQVDLLSGAKRLATFTAPLQVA